MYTMFLTPSNTVEVSRGEEVLAEYEIVDGELQWKSGKLFSAVFAREDRMIQAAGTHGGLLEALTINGTWRTSL